MKEILEQLVGEIEKMDIADKVNAINDIKARLKSISPFGGEPVECVQWVKEELVIANDYNPNTVAPPEMELLHTSIQEDGYTQPIVVYQHDGIYEVVDGFHRNRVGKEYKDIHDRIHGYLPVTIINDDRHEKADRIASTIRHNRARGKHRVEAMSDIVIELKRRNWSDSKIAKELGMDADEVLRLTQITGLAEMFADKDFSEAWEVDTLDESDYIDEVFEGDDGNINGYNKIKKPAGHTWKSFAILLINSMPPKTQEHYKNKIYKFISWWKERGYPEGIPDEADYQMEQKKDVPSWRRICKSLLRNDFWCKGLSFTQQKSHAYERYLQMMKQKRTEDENQLSLFE